jgi:hypothetical protein
MYYHAVLENPGEGKVFVRFYQGENRSRLEKSLITRVNFSDEKRLGELVHDFHMALNCKAIKDEGQMISLEYNSPVDGVDVLSSFCRYFAKLSERDKCALWIQC